MKRVFAMTTALAFAGTVALMQGASGQTGDGWTQLFDGKTLNGWTSVGNGNWRVEDGAIVAD